jgi:3-oxoacyl-[acyl-carrier-protein] synthase-1
MTVRVVVTGMGIVSSLGSDTWTVLSALREGRSGLIHLPEMAELGFRCSVYAPVRGWDPGRIGKRELQTMSLTAQYAMHATLEALEDARLPTESLQNERTGVVVGAAFGGLHEATRAEHVLTARRSPSRLGGTAVVKIMNSTASANIAARFGIRGRSYSVSSAFSSGADSIGNAYELIRYGVQDVCICGASEEDSWRSASISFETAGALPADFNDRPAAACRPFDRDRQGLVLSEGAGILVLESFDHAVERGARVHAEVVGYAAANDGEDMFRPTGTGLRAAVRSALVAAASQGVTSVDYVNAHGTGTVIGDPVEAAVLAEIFGERVWVSSTKGLAGHGMGATGAQEAVYTLLMLSNDFVAPTANLENIAPECSGVRHAQAVREEPLTAAVSVNSGFGGTNACLVFRKLAPGAQ